MDPHDLLKYPLPSSGERPRRERLITQPAPTDAKAIAGAEWDGGKVDQSRWISRDVYIAARRRELHASN